LPVLQGGREVPEKIGQTNTLAERCEHAQQCVAALKLKIPALVDREDNRVNRMYAGWPDRLYIVDRQGQIAVAGPPGPWGFKPEMVETWLKQNTK
jgi:hypothetical protein